MYLPHQVQTIFKLSKLFTIIDFICSQLVLVHYFCLFIREQVQKIKTVGNVVLIAVGVPLPCQNHAEVALKLAEQMFITLKSSSAKLDCANLSMRIGVASGPLTSGVIGR